METHPIVQLALESIWIFFPAIIANMAPVFAAQWNLFPSLNLPLDGGSVWRNKRIFGKNKTVRGIVVGSALAVLMSVIQGRGALVGLLLGVGALTGDAIKSFFKRQVGIPPGRSFLVFDQTDFVIGSIIALSFVERIPFQHALAAIIILGIGSFVASVIGVAFGIKRSL